MNYFEPRLENNLRPTVFQTELNFYHFCGCDQFLSKWATVYRLTNFAWEKYERNFLLASLVELTQKFSVPQVDARRIPFSFSGGMEYFFHYSWSTILHQHTLGYIPHCLIFLLEIFFTFVFFFNPYFILWHFPLHRCDWFQIPASFCLSEICSGLVSNCVNFVDRHNIIGTPFINHTVFLIKICADKYQHLENDIILKHRST